MLLSSTFKQSRVFHKGFLKLPPPPQPQTLKRQKERNILIHTNIMQPYLTVCSQAIFFPHFLKDTSKAPK